MGKLKVSFTTALFIFSFIICVIVAVVFVDRAPQNDYDSFYDKAGEDEGNGKRDSEDTGWNSRRQAADKDKPAPAATPAPTVDESSFADLPIDAHLRDAAQPVVMTATPVPTANPLQGRSPEEIARMHMGQFGIPAATGPAPVPGMAVPEGIVTPAVQSQAAATPQRFKSEPLPLQSNVGGPAGPGIGGTLPSATAYPGISGPGATGLPSLGANPTNTVDGWNPVSAKQTPDRMLGVRSAPANAQSGMMISQGKAAGNAEAPPGFTESVTSHQPAPASAAPQGLDTPLLLAPQPAPGSNKYELPPAPTLPPPPIQDPDRRRSDADTDTSETETPDSLNPEGSSGQALAFSEIPEEASDPIAEPEVKHAAQVNERTLTDDQAVKLAEVNFLLNDAILTEDKRAAEAKAAAEQWADIVAAAELARANDIYVAVPEVEKYAGMRPDFDPAAWQAAMAEKGFPKEEIRDLLRDIALSEKLVELEFESTVNDDDLEKAYKKTPSKFASPRQVHLQEIYKDKPDDEARAAKVEDSMNRLRRQAASGIDFALLARQASQAPNRQKGGDLGWITPDAEKDEQRDKAIADLKPGEVSAVIEEPDGYRIYKLVAVKEASNDFEGGKDLVVAELKKPVRKESLSEARKKLESGEPLVKEIITTAKAAKPEPDRLPEAAKPDAGSKEKSKAEIDAARKEKAREVLAQAAARRRAAAAEQQPAGPVTVTQQPGTANQLLYAPGSQVQQMAGGQPAPAFQPGGQTPAPVQSPLTAPNSVSVSYTPGQTMGIADYDTGTPIVPNPAAGIPLAPDPSTYETGELQSQALTPLQMQALMQAQPVSGVGQTPQNGAAAAQPGPPEPEATPAPVMSNGWLVTKMTPSPEAVEARASGSRRGRHRGSGENRPAVVSGPAEPAGTIPPGFEGSNQEVAAPAGQSSSAEEQREGRGLVGSVKSFFGGFRK